MGNQASRLGTLVTLILDQAYKVILLATIASQNRENASLEGQPVRELTLLPHLLPHSPAFRPRISCLKSQFENISPKSR